MSESEMQLTEFLIDEYICPKCDKPLNIAENDEVIFKWCETWKCRYCILIEKKP